VAIALALAQPQAALSQEMPAAQETAAELQDDAAPATDSDSDSDELFSIEDSDEPERLKELTQVHSSVEAGIFYVSGDSFRYGRYSGLNEQGAGLVLNLDLLQRGAWDADRAGYWSFNASNLGLDSRKAALEFGVQGKYKVRVDYDQIPNFRNESTRTIFDGAGGTDLTLLADWVGSGNTAGMTQLLSSLKPFELKTERHQAGVGISGILAPRWNYRVSYKRERKEGTRSIGAVFGNSGGNPRSVIVPEPVDYTTQQFDVALSYGTRKFQIEAAYYASLFSDENKSLVWSNPYTTISGWAPGTGFPNGRGQLSLPPDNQFHQFSVNAGYNISDRTRVSGSVARGRMTQNEAFLPYSYILSLQASITQPLPRDSLDGRIDTTVVNLRISSRPWEDFSWNASYRYDDRDNNTPRDEYVYIGGDSQTQQTGVTSNRRRYNEPYSFKEQQFKIDASYRVFGHTDLSAGAQHSKIDRTYSEREQADETTYNLGVKTEVGERFSGQLRYTHARRDGSTYYGDEPFHSGYSPGYVATIPGGWENHPDLRRFFLANRDRDLLNATISFTPTEAWTISGSLDHARDEYNESELGLIASQIDGYTLDVVYAPSPLWSAYAFYSHEKLASEQRGHSFRGGTNQIPDSTNPDRAWFVDHLDRIDSYGLGLKHSSSSGRVDCGIDYVYSKSRSDLDFAVGAALLTAPLPRDVTRLDSVNAYATFKMNDQLSLRFGAWYEHFHSTDWAVDGIAPNQLANVILLGEDSPDYNLYVLSFSAIYRF
jgi:MtrB/PioB family decaheme-associated outer membrane protein